MKRTVDFAHIVKELQEAGITQTELAQATGLTKGGISAIAKGRTTDPGWSTGDYLIRKHFETFQVRL